MTEIATTIKKEGGSPPISRFNDNTFIQFSISYEDESQSKQLAPFYSITATEINDRSKLAQRAHGLIKILMPRTTNVAKLVVICNDNENKLLPTPQTPSIIQQLHASIQERKLDDSTKRFNAGLIIIAGIVDVRIILSLASLFNDAYASIASLIVKRETESESVKGEELYNKLVDLFKDKHPHMSLGVYIRSTGYAKSSGHAAEGCICICCVYTDSGDTMQPEETEDEGEIVVPEREVNEETLMKELEEDLGESNENPPEPEPEAEPESEGETEEESEGESEEKESMPMSSSSTTCHDTYAHKTHHHRKTRTGDNNNNDSDSDDEEAPAGEKGCTLL